MGIIIIIIIIIIFILKVIIISGGILILLVFRHEIIHIALCLGELHLIHSLSSVPVQECLTSEHCSELLSHPMEHILNGSGVTNECSGHLEPSWWDIADRG